MFEIIRASESHLTELVPLFNQYRIFYEQTSDELSARKFLEDRFRKGECIVFLAIVNKEPAGFTLLYSSFSSVSLKPVFILNDLYVKKGFRHNGIGEQLLERTKELCLEKGYKGLAIETATDNPARQLYEKLGWKKDTRCFHYFWDAG